MELKDVIALIEDKLSNHRHKQQYFRKLDRLYDGEYDILKKEKKKIEKANNQLVHNFAKVIIRNSNAYFLGDKIVFSYPNPNVNKILQDIIGESNLMNHLLELTTNACKFGVSYLLAYINPLNELKFISLNPANVILHKNIFGQSQYAITLAEQYDFITDKKDIYITYYTKEMICEFIIKDGSEKLETMDVRPNKLGRIPVIEFKNNIDSKNDIEDVLSLINAYNLIQSNKIDDNEELRHSILHMNNVIPGEEFYKSLREYNVIATKDGNEGKKVDIKYLTKTPDIGAEAILDRLNRDIFTIAGIPDFANLDFTGGDTIIAIKSKLYPLISKTKEKEELFISSFRYLFQLLEKYISIRYSINFSYKLVEITFVRPNFTNISEELDNAQKMKGLDLISDDTILNNLSIIKNTEEEKEKYQKQINSAENSEKMQKNEEKIDYFND